jgi:hypothetical protein
MVDGGLQGGLTEPHVITLTDEERCGSPSSSSSSSSASSSFPSISLSFVSSIRRKTIWFVKTGSGQPGGYYSK